MEKEKNLKIKNMILISIMTILIILGISNISIAKTYDYQANSGLSLPPVDEITEYFQSGQDVKFRLSMNEYDRFPNRLLCIEHKQKLSHHKYVNYKVISTFTIRGNTCNSIEQDAFGKWNAKLAAAIHYTSGKQRREAMWYYFHNWVNEVGKYFGVPSYATNANNEGISTALKEKVNNYANSVNDVGGFENAYIKQNKTKVTAKMCTNKENREKYIKVGPFNFEFFPKIESMTIEGHEIGMGDDIRVIIDNAKIARSDGDIISINKANKLLSGEEFSILIPIRDKIDKITSIKIKTEKMEAKELITAKFAILMAGTGSEAYQNLAIVETKAKDVEKARASLEVSKEIPIGIDIKIEKVNSKDHSEKLPNVGFKLRNKQLDLWVKQQDGRTTYVKSEKNATTFNTNSKGQKTIYGLLLGDYEFKETVQPNYGFICETRNFTLDTNKAKIEGKLYKQTVENDPGGMTIKKVDETNTDITIPNVKFKLYIVRTNEWVHLDKDTGNVTYVDEANATEFTTDEKGQASIGKLKAGAYVFKETEVPEGYKCENKFFTVTADDVNSTKPVTYTIKNTPTKDGIMIIEKVNSENHNIKIPTVVFKLRNLSRTENQWVYKSTDGEISYVDEASASMLYTGDDGRRTIGKLEPGNYEFYEISTPETYKCENKYFTVTESDASSTASIVYTIENTPIRNAGVLIKKVDEDDINKPIPNVIFKLRNLSKKEGQWVYKDTSGKVSYVENQEDSSTFYTGEDGTREVGQLEPGNYEFYEVSTPDDYQCENKYFTITYEDAELAKTQTVEYKITNKKKSNTGNILIEKVDEDNQNIKLDIGFKLKALGDDTWVYQVSPSEVMYVNDEASATTFYTRDGKCSISNLLAGEYEFKEVDVPYYGFTCTSKYLVVREDDSASLQYNLITNKQEYIKLSGRVWIDKHSGKQNIRNDLFNTDYHYSGSEYVDDADEPVSGLTVKLMKNETVEKTTVTGSDGTYIFENVSIDELKNYYIEFEYNGLTYTNVEPHLDNDNGSKAIEGKVTRDTYNQNFEYVENGGSQVAGVTKDSSKEVKHNIEYNINSTSHTAELADKYKDINNKDLVITANTSRASYNLYEQYQKQKSSSTTEIDCVKYNNLGVYERTQPDMAIVKDIQNVRVAINGYNHIYEYAQRFVNQGEYGDGYDLGIKFGNKYGTMEYTRPIYKSDYMWESSNKSKELKVYITYKIQIKNESTNLKTRINSIVDYYDNNYELIEVGRTLSGDGLVGSGLAKNSSGYDSNYNKLIIDTSDVRIEPQTTEDIYVQFRLDRQKVNDILSNKEILDNVVEINSYSVFDEKGDIYAGIDKDSAPGNAVPGKPETYEDDTDTAPAFKLTVSENARQVSGTVFYDKTENEDGLLTAKIREGNGQLDSEEKGIKGVQVQLVERTETGEIGEVYYIGKNDVETSKPTLENSKTDDDGNFTISGFIPGDYEIVYTWGGNFTKESNINVQDYKGTVYDEDRYNEIKSENESSGSLEGGGTSAKVYKWYKEEETPRYTDAIDDYATRQAIDKELKTKTYSSDSTKVDFNKIMDSTTQIMKVAVEYDDDAFKSGDHRVSYKYEINNIDFGIVRRAKQSVELNKRVSAMKVTLANGQVVSDVTITEKGGVLEGSSTDHTTYMGPSSGNAGFAKIELDNELLQGSKVEVTYEFKFINQSEVDLINETYYKFGSKSMKKASDTKYELIQGTSIKGYAKESDVVKIKPTTIVDYLDRDWGYEADKNKNWQAITKEEFIEDYKEKGLASEAIFGEDSAINNKIILVTSTWNGKEAELVLPGKHVITNLNVSKLLNTTDDISLDNETEIIELTKGSKVPGKPVDPDDITPGGSNIIQTPGNYVPVETPGGTTEPDTDIAETVIVTPSTGANLEFVMPVTVAVIALVILGTGIVLIKKKVIDIKK